MINTKIYLCGGIKDLSDEEASEWRNKAIDELENRPREFKKGLKNTSCVRQFKCLDPMRRNFRDDEFQSQNEIVQLDKADIIACDIMIVNATKPSWGTAMEILFAFEHNKIVVCFTGNDYEETSPWVAFHSTRVCETMKEAVTYIRDLKC